MALLVVRIMRRCATCCPKPNADPGDDVEAVFSWREQSLEELAPKGLVATHTRQARQTSLQTTEVIMCDIQKPLPHGTRGETCLDFVPWVC
jgi:hypothetical protein